MTGHQLGAREEWLAGLARDYADASDDARDDHEPAIEIPLLDEPDDLGAWTCCGGKRWHTDDCDQGPTPNQIIGRFPDGRLREPDDTEDDDADTHRPPAAKAGVHLVWSPAPHGSLPVDGGDAHVAGPAGATGGHDDRLPVCGTCDGSGVLPSGTWYGGIREYVGCPECYWPEPEPACLIHDTSGEDVPGWEMAECTCPGRSWR